MTDVASSARPGTASERKMKLTLSVAAALLVCQAVWLLDGASAQDKDKDKGPPAAQKPTLTPVDVLKAEIDALKPAKHVWRAIDWKTCPLEALRASREQKK